MEDEPPASSESGLPPAAPTYKLYDYRAVCLATILGSALAGSILMALNYRRLGDAAAAVKILVVGILVTGLVSFSGWFSGTMQGAMPIVLTLIMMYSAKVIQGPSLEHHVRLGGKLGSMWTALGVGLAILLSLLLIMVGYSYVTAPMNKVIIGTKDKVYYFGTATEQDAEALGQALKSGGYLQDRGGSVLLTKDKDGVTISFVVKEGFWNDPESVSALAEAGRKIAPAVGGLPIKVRLVDSNWNTKKEVTVK